MPPNLLRTVQAAAGALKSEEYSINTLEPMEAILAREGVDQDAHILTDAALKALDSNVDLMYSGWRKPINEFGKWLERTGTGEAFYYLATYGSMAAAEAAMAAARGKGNYEPGPENDAVVSQEDSAAAKEAGAIGSGEIGSVEGAGDYFGKPYSGTRNTDVDFVNKRGNSTLKTHFDDHASDFSYATEAEYESGATYFLEKPPTSTTQSFVTKDGTYFRYDTATNEFGIMNKYGGISTYYKPKTGIDYWLDQISAYAPK